MSARRKDKRLLPMGSCHGEDNKRRILDHYRLTELFHGISLDDSIQGCCQETALSEFHRFDFQIREGKKRTDLPEHGVMYVGTHCASEFRRLMIEKGEAHKWPTFFNPLKTFNISARGDRANGNKPSVSRPQITVEAETILSLMMTAYPTIAENPDKPMLKFYNDIQRFPRSVIYDSRVQGINTAIGNYLASAGISKPFVEVVKDRVANRGEELRSFDFPCVNALLKARNQPNNICGYQRS